MAQRSRFLDTGAGSSSSRYAPARPGRRGEPSVSLGFLVDDALRERVRFCDDPAVPRVDVNLTCELPPLPSSAATARPRRSSTGAGSQAEEALRRSHRSDESTVNSPSQQKGSPLHWRLLTVDCRL